MAKNKTPSRYIPKHVKEAVRLRDRDICQICYNTSEYMEFDHITPFSKGAPATVENIQLLCRKCNIKKRNKTDNDCKKCGGWNPHNAKFCHSCGFEMPKNIKYKEEKSVGFFEDLFDLSGLGFSGMFWLIRKVIGVLLILFSLIWLYQYLRHK
jgi:ribosomal protein L37E